MIETRAYKGKKPDLRCRSSCCPIHHVTCGLCSDHRFRCTLKTMPDKIPSNYSLEATHLPNEILAIIINELPPDEERNLAALASCRLASHVLCSLATPLFFSSIHLTATWLDDNAKMIANFQERAGKLHQILNINDIAALVQTLRFKCFQGNLKNETNGNLVFEILHRLPRLQKFCLNNWIFSSITGRVGSAIEALCRSPNLTTLDLCSVRVFPITAIIASPSSSAKSLVPHMAFWCKHGHKLVLYAINGAKILAAVIYKSEILVVLMY